MAETKHYNSAVHEWDEAKRQVNLRKHGLDFADMDAFDWEAAIVAEGNHHDEPRWAATGYIGERLCVAVYTVRGDVVRMISLRNATPAERRRYAET